MEDMCTIFVHMDTLYILAIEVATKVGTLVNHQTSLTGFLGKVGKRGTI